MRNLIILRGIPASGKSTFVKNYEQYVVSSDNLRLLYAGIEYDLEGHQRISQKADKKVWNTLFEIVEGRMKDGLLTIIDATHTSEKSIKAYDKLCEKYNYRMTIVEFNVDVEEAIKRNNNRIEYKQVPENVIRDMVERMKQPLSSKHQKYIVKAENYEKLDYMIYGLSTSTESLSEYKKVVVFGDIHSSYEPLKEYFNNNPYIEDNFYIFLGDLFDRNYQANEVAEFMYNMIQKENVIVLQGNHENWIKAVLRGESPENTTPEFNKTWNLLSDENKEKVKAIGRKVRQCYEFAYYTNTFICTHGGISTPFFDTTMPTRQLIKGVGSYEDMQKCDEMFTELEKDWHVENNMPEDCHVYSIHGHRNLENVDIQNTDRTFNLCDDVEHGGYLRVLEITKDGFTPIKIKNDTYIKRSDKLYTDEIIKKLHESGYVKEKELNDGIVSFNFTREAFYKDHWDDISVLARGLFVDSETGKIVARSYSKFFNAWFEENDSNTEHEYGDCSIYTLKDKIKFPVSVYKKENGYLGIVSWDYKNSDFFIASKSTNLGDYALHFKEMFMKWYNNNIDTAKENIKKVVQDNQSMIFEVIDEEFDPHVIHNADTKQFVLLDIVKNDFSETYWSYEELNKFAQDNYFIVKSNWGNIDSFDSLVRFLEGYNKFSLDQKQYGKAFEGFVIQDTNGFRFKFKTAYYCFWKSLRNKLEAYKTGHNVNFSLEEKELLSKLGPIGFCCEKNVLQLQKIYYDKED